jgi:ABC-type glycerol-3-phosphate transport system substrate-binding protein
MRKSKGALALAVGLTVLAAAGTAMAAKKPATEITCEEFLALGSEVQPRVVYWMEAYSADGKLEDLELDLNDFSRPIVGVIDACQKEPKASLWDKVKDYFRDPDLAP